MPFASKRQARAMFGGHIPNMTKEDARQWAHETKDMKKLPERAPAEKGKPTMRSKKANGDMLQHFLDNPKKAENYLDRKERERTRRGKTAAAIVSEVADYTPELEVLLTDVFKGASLGTAVMNPRNVGKLRGMMTTNALKAPGYGPSAGVTNPRRNIISAMNAGKPK